MTETATSGQETGSVLERTVRGGMIQGDRWRVLTYFCDDDSPLKVGDKVAYTIEDGKAVDITIQI